MILFDYDKASHLMAKQGIDILLPHTQPNAGYLADYWSHWIKSPYYRGEEGSLYWIWVGLPRDRQSDPFITCRTGGEESDMTYSRVWIQDKRLWGPTSPARAAVSAIGNHRHVASDAITAVAAALTERGLANATIGVELLYLSVETYRRLQKCLPGARFIDAGDLFEELRIVKCAEEIRRIEIAARATEKAIQTAFKRMRPGTTGYELERILSASHAEQGMTHNFNHVNLGPHGAIIINPSEEQVEAGEIVRLDVGCSYKDYLSDISGVAVLGEPRDEIHELYKAARRGYEAMFEDCKAGVRCSAVYETVARVLAESGLATFCTMVGHGVGRDIHEAPYVTADNDAPLQANMVLTIEIALMVRDLGAMCLEDMVVINEDGLQPLSALGHELTIVN